MKPWLRRCVLLAPFSLLAQIHPPGSRGQRDREPEPADTRLPNGKLQRDEILKQEHKQNLKDVDQLISMAKDLKADLEKNEHYVLSLATLKKTDEMEKLIRKIRSRMQHS